MCQLFALLMDVSVLGLKKNVIYIKVKAFNIFHSNLIIPIEHLQT